ncbi:MAG: methylenetetrahydrofolate reductase [NAD(P)H] [Clostridiales bacterium]|nr:methylenetetrahydrofolate reductase [NAD(P)H] [Clostridiales bacterium]MDD6539509.1 methylenetetrahydrofolate reductase [NAD(P)H] [Bacillota bacterium]MDD7016717.1 methylenetetrahydrofolate reductase [NAD(P)H] [Bacillota bacterium]MDY4959164.1 methylenetetrahydrofolate reductase [NAD(P)H] [Lentihominibacter sp.]
MKIPELFEQKKPVFSFEIFPPKRESNIDNIYRTVEGLTECRPDFISVTYGAGGTSSNYLTCDIAARIKHEYGIEPLAHLTCVNSSKLDVRIMIERFIDANIENVMALRGDIIPDMERQNDFEHANDLAIELQRKCQERIEILGACYPEGHYQSKSIDEDIQNLKYKIGAGVKVLITQLFFDNDKFYSYVGKARNMGIKVPITAGIMPIVKKSQIEKTIKLSGSSIPDDFAAMIEKYQDNPEALYDAGIDYAVRQARDLIMNGTDGIHIYTMNNADVARRVHSGVKDLL